MFSEQTTWTMTTQHDGTGRRIFDRAPRLVPREERAAARSTDPSLRAIERGDTSNAANQFAHERISEEDQAMRAKIFILVGIGSILPFISLPALAGGFNAALVNMTGGRVTRFSDTQRRILKWELAIFSIGFAVALIGMIIDVTR